jgi:hypothetical protein
MYLKLLLDHALGLDGRLGPRRIDVIAWERSAKLPFESHSKVVETSVADPVVFIVRCPAFTYLFRLKRCTRQQKRLPAELAVVMVPIGPPKEVVPSVDSYALQVFLPVEPPVIIHFTKMPEPRDGLQLSQLLAIRRA